MPNPNRPVLSLAEIDAFDPQGPPARKWCPLCDEGKPKDAAHRSLSFDWGSGLWKCFRCGQSGQAREFWAEKPQDTHQTWQVNLYAAFDLSPSAAPLLHHQSPPQSRFLRPLRTIGAPSVKGPPPEGTPGESYLLMQGIPIEVARLAEVRWSSNWSGNGSVMFPVRGRGGEIVAVKSWR